jgi:hypothetical protein
MVALFLSRLKGQDDGYERSGRFNTLVGRRIQNIKKVHTQKSNKYTEFNKTDESEND